MEFVLSDAIFQSQIAQRQKWTRGQAISRKFGLVTEVKEYSLQTQSKPKPVVVNATAIFLLQVTVSPLLSLFFLLTVSAPPGFRPRYPRGSNTEMIRCPKGTYQHKSGGTRCYPCPPEISHLCRKFCQSSYILARPVL